MSCSRAPQTAGDAAVEVGAGGRASQEQAPDDSHLAHVCADVKTGEGGYVKLAIIMSMMAQTIQCGGVCAKRLGSDLTTYRLETACTTTRTLPECNCHCFPCLLCVPRLETCTLGCPPRGASSTLRDTDLFIFWGAYCLWFVPLLRMFRGTVGWRHACACARDTDEASTRVHTAHRSTRSARRETRGASHAASCERTPACREGSRGRQPADDGQPAGR